MLPSIDDCFARGYDRLYAGDPAGASAAFRCAVLLDPAGGEAWAALGETLAGQPGGTPEAISAFQHAVLLDPGSWHWRTGHAEALLRGGRAGEAVERFALLAAERPDAAVVRLGHARALAAAGRAGEALGEYREAVALRPDDVGAALALGALLIAEGDALAAAELLQPLARRHPDDARLQHRIGEAWVALREPDKALAALRRARELDPDDGHGGAALIAALEAGEGADLSAAYVRALFDRYADRFDRDLVGKLGYAAPDLLRDAVDRLGGPRGGLRVFDLGCGTGLAGVAFRPLAGHLAGVDLSPRMVDKARDRRLYDSLEVGDVVAALESSDAPWDLLVAADVLVYIGDLAPLFRAAAGHLAAGGRFAATVERLEGAEAFALGPARRYAHSESYIRTAAQSAGLRVLMTEPCTPRREKGVGVPGLLFVLER
ncbi:tetratricopeptide repeat protein [Azospirillum thermophilum]|uniref:tetratricopeptide repeat protein n=1 Tax=Azospirillum thermophilum TaxID=2202148 RepID=UPI001FE3E18E|nr:tetratricopeptide repeat protein [Azospirillum thermophilum]